MEMSTEHGWNDTDGADGSTVSTDLHGLTRAVV